MNKHPACGWCEMTMWMRKTVGVATLACSPGLGVGVLDCWGVCTNVFKHTNQLNPAHMQIFRNQANQSSIGSPLEWNLPRSHQSPRKAPPTAAETERASTSVGRMVGEKASESHQGGAES